MAACLVRMGPGQVSRDFEGKAQLASRALSIPDAGVLPQRKHAMIPCP